jgi:epsilon-lactone hydrolase
MPSPEHQMLVEQLRSQPILANSVAEMRATLEMMGQAFQVPADVRCEKVSADGVPCEWVTAPGASADRAVLYFHGGGYVIGSINTHRELGARLSRASGTRVLLVDYRLAPEHPFPAAVEDATTAYRWLLAQGLSPRKIVVAGDSAGGGLTVAALVAIRDQKLPLPAAGVPLSPWCDLEGIGESSTGKTAEDPMVKLEGLHEFARHYLAGKDPRTPLAAPLYADLSGLPPLYIQVGTAEILLDDATRLAERAKKAGVDVTLEAFDGLVHVFQLFPHVPEATQGTDKIGAFIRRIVG